MSKFDEFRPQPRRKNDLTISAKLQNDEEKEQLEQMAAELGMSRSALIRAFVVLGIREYRAGQ
jgi:AraC-like DNA-binding protein